MKGITSKRAARAYDLSCCQEGADGASDRQFAHLTRDPI